MNEIKQIIVMRKDLNMRKGKMIAQGAHASMKVILDRMTKSSEFYEQEWLIWKLSMLESNPICKWLKGSFKKIVVYVDSENELMEVYNNANSKNLLCSLITDNGLTEFNGVPTITCCAIGPDYEEKIDEITGHLKLL